MILVQMHQFFNLLSCNHFTVMAFQILFNRIDRICYLRICFRFVFCFILLQLFHC